MHKIIETAKKGYSYFDNNFYNVLIAFLIILNISPVLAPILAKLGLTPLAQIIYFIYSFFCHQLDWRSLHAFDFQYAWCVRDTFIWLNILIIGILTVKFKIKPIKWYWLIPFMVPIALDGGIQTVATILGIFNSQPEYISTNLNRMVTGTIFGLGFGLWIMPNMWEAGTNSDNRKSLPLNLSVLKILIGLFIANFALYIFLVWFWQISSPTNKPSDFLDYSVKTPANTSQWLIRRAHAV